MRRNPIEEPFSIALTTSPQTLPSYPCRELIFKNTTGVTISWRRNTADGRASASGYTDAVTGSDEPVIGITNTNQIDVKAASGTPTLQYVAGKDLT